LWSWIGCGLGSTPRYYAPPTSGSRKVRPKPRSSDLPGPTYQPRDPVLFVLCFIEHNEGRAKYLGATRMLHTPMCLVLVIRLQALVLMSFNKPTIIIMSLYPPICHRSVAVASHHNRTPAISPPRGPPPNRPTSRNWHSFRRRQYS
jgi:hypothetical protein